jgi:hypothetical protein
MITFDDSLWPLLTVTFTGVNSMQEFEAYLAKLSTYAQRGEKYIALFDSSAATTAPSMEQRQRQVEWIQQHEAHLRNCSLGSAFVIKSPFIRLALNIIYQIRPPPSPYLVVGDISTARGWAADRFREAGMTLPSVLIRSHYGLMGGKVAAAR